ncbi:polynucleotide adenylyltransferase PcnB [Treponema sp.]
MRIRYSAAENGKPVKKAIVYTKNEHKIDRSAVDNDALRIVERLKEGGHETYIVGGAVRDLVIGNKPKDFDIVTDAPPTRIKRLFRNSRIIGRRFRLVHVFFGPKIYEVSTFRSLKDGTTSNTYGTVDEDVLRRDFTFNALFYDPQEEVVVDYVGGFKDILAKRVKPVIPLKIIFKDDPVRMLRAAKYAASTGFKLPLSLQWKIKAEASLLAPVSPSRLTEEILKIINSGYSRRIVELMDKLGIFMYLQPRAAILMKQSPAFRSDYLESLSQLDQSQHSDTEARSGRHLSFLIRSFLDRELNWESASPESYKEAFVACRSYVLPMNPPRVELENALRLLFRDHGLVARKARSFERGARRDLSEGRATEAVGKEGLNQEGALDLAEGEAKKKKRRRKRRKSPPSSTMGSPE